MQKKALCDPGTADRFPYPGTLAGMNPAGKRPQWLRDLTKMLFIMKLIAVLLLMGMLAASAKGRSQTITYSAKNAKIAQVFKAIETQTGYTVFANKDLLKGVKPVSVSARQMQLTEFLNAILADQPIGYEIHNKTIFIKNKPASQIIVSRPVTTVVAEPPPLELSGIVLSEDGSPLAGATVMIKGGRISVITTAEGRFSINADAGQVLVISYIGHQSQEVTVDGKNLNLSVRLKKQATEIEQVVVTALGITRKSKALTYNVQEVKSEEINRVKDANFINSLNGKVAGVTINSSAGGIAGSSRVVMRGSKSLFGNNNALYVVDGIPLPSLTTNQPNDIFTGSGVSGDGISNINPDDIASVSVLTGPAAAALYGSAAANGVILVTTRKGEKGKLNLSVTNTTNFFSPFVLPRFQNTYGSDEGNFYSWGPKLDKPTDYDPADFFQTGVNVMNSISLSTGTDKNQTYFSAASTNAKGIIMNNKLNRYNFSIRNTASLLDDRLSLDLSLMYITLQEQNMLSQGQYFNPLVPVYLFPRGDDIEKYKIYERYNPSRNFKTQFWPFGDMGFQMQNPYWITQRDMFNNDKERYLMSAGLKYTLNDWINITGRVKYDRNTTIAEKRFYASTAGLFASDAGAYHHNSMGTKQLYTDVLVNINRNLGRDYVLSANVGASLIDDQFDQDSYGGNLQSVPNLFTFSNVNNTQATATQTGYHDQTQSVFASAQLSYRNRIFVDATGRNDWSSALVNTNAKSIFYPSVGVSGIVSDLLNMHSRAVSFIKVRGSYSEVGNAPQRFVTIATYPIIGGFPVTSSYLPASGLQPERTKSFEAGLNIRFLRNKINLDVTAYRSVTYNQLFNPTLAPSTGYSSFYVNAGEVSNKGIEATLGVNHNIGPVLWNSNLVFTLNRNRINKLLTSNTNHITGQTVTVDSLSVGGTGSYMMALVKGGQMGDIYVNTLVVDEHGFIDVGLQTQTVTADPNTYIKAGNANPRYNLGFRNGFSYKNFNLDFLVSARIGGVGVSVTQAIMDRFGVSEASALARDNGGVIVNGQKIPAQPYYEVTGGGVAGVGSMYVYSATNVRLAEASLSYTIPAHVFHNKIKGITASVVGRNLFMFYNKSPFDPELTANTGTYYQGIDYFMQPSLRSIGFSVKFQF